MKTRTIGDSGLEVSVIGLGTNNFGTRLDIGQCAEVLGACQRFGVTFLDTADVYADGRSEEILGELLDGRRDEFVLATKVGMRWDDDSSPGGLNPAYIAKGVRESLVQLRTDYVDLLQLHVMDPRVPLEDVLGALGDLVDAGLVRHVGCSNFMAWELVEWKVSAKQESLPQFVSIQSEYSMLVRDAETELLHACKKLNIGLIPYRPLAQGFLTGKYARGDTPPEGTRLALQDHVREARETPANWAAMDAIQPLASEKSCTPAQLAIAWVLQQPHVPTVIAGASNPGQVRDNAGAAEIDFTTTELEQLDAALPAVPGGAVGALPMRRHLLGP